MDPGVFRAHVRWMVESPVPVVSVDELLTMPGEGPGMAVTFDDGFRNFATEAAPVLLEWGLPVTVFLVTGRMGGTNDWDAGDESIPALPLLDWKEAGRLAETGVEIGAHSRTHPRMEALEASRLDEEVGGSAEDIRARLGTRPRGFAYPYGVCDRSAAARVQEEYDWAVTAELAPLSGRPRSHRLPRLDAYYLRRPDALEGWGTGALRRALTIRRIGRRIRGLVGGGAGG